MIEYITAAVAIISFVLVVYVGIAFAIKVFA